MSNSIRLEIDALALERLIKDQHIKLEEIHCPDDGAHRRIQRLLLEVLKAQLK